LRGVATNCTIDITAFFGVKQRFLDFLHFSLIYGDFMAPLGREGSGVYSSYRQERHGAIIEFCHGVALGMEW
jgi:hypothetical protein